MIQHGPCPYCGVQMVRAPKALRGERRGQRTPDNYSTRDHILPEIMGGTYSIRVCRKCNGDKGRLTIEVWLQILKWKNDPRAERIAAFFDANPHLQPLMRGPVQVAAE